MASGTPTITLNTDSESVIIARPVTPSPDTPVSSVAPSLPAAAAAAASGIPEAAAAAVAVASQPLKQNKRKQKESAEAADDTETDDDDRSVKKDKQPKQKKSKPDPLVDSQMAVVQEKIKCARVEKEKNLLAAKVVKASLHIARQTQSVDTIRRKAVSASGFAKAATDAAAHLQKHVVDGMQETTALAKRVKALETETKKFAKVGREANTALELVKEVVECTKQLQIGREADRKEIASLKADVSRLQKESEREIADLKATVSRFHSELKLELHQKLTLIFRTHDEVTPTYRTLLEVLLEFFRDTSPAAAVAKINEAIGHDDGTLPSDNTTFIGALLHPLMQQSKDVFLAERTRALAAAAMTDLKEPPTTRSRASESGMDMSVAAAIAHVSVTHLKNAHTQIAEAAKLKAFADTQLAEAAQLKRAAQLKVDELALSSIVDPDPFGLN